MILMFDSVVLLQNLKIGVEFTTLKKCSVLQSTRCHIRQQRAIEVQLKEIFLLYFTLWFWGHQVVEGVYYRHVKLYHSGIFTVDTSDYAD